jgi:hypothetical protein
MNDSIVDPMSHHFVTSAFFTALRVHARGRLFRLPLAASMITL